MLLYDFLEAGSEGVLDGCRGGFGGLGCLYWCWGGLGCWFHAPQVLELVAALQQVVDAGQQQFRRAWFGDVSVGTALVALDLVLFKRSCREQDNGDVTGDVILFHLLAELQAVHHRHHHVTHDQVGHLFPGEFKAAPTVLGLQ